MRHIPREENQCVDCITKLAFIRKEKLRMIENPSEEVLNIINADKERIFCRPNSHHVT